MGHLLEPNVYVRWTGTWEGKRRRRQMNKEGYRDEERKVDKE